MDWMASRPWMHSDLDHQRWWSDLIRHFFNYLAFDAYEHLKEKGVIALKSYFTMNFILDSWIVLLLHTSQVGGSA